MMYDELDRLILDAIDRQKSPLYERGVWAEAERIACAAGRDSFRVIDGRMQALKRQKRIQWLSKKAAVKGGAVGWQLAPPPKE